MKKNLLLICAVAVICADHNRVFAQPSAPKSHSHLFSVFAGYGSSKILNSSYIDPPGWEFGFGGNFLKIGTNLNLRTEPKLTGQGGKYAEPTYSGEVKLTYVQLPILVNFMKNRHGFFVETGLQPGLIVKATDTYTVTGSPTVTQNFINGINTFEIGVPVSAGYIFKNGFGLGLRFVRGISNVEKNLNSRNQIITGRIYYTFISPPPAP